jgi:hypothetical protein
MLNSIVLVSNKPSNKFSFVDEKTKKHAFKMAIFPN